MLTNKSIVITGAAGLIGRRTALACAQAGANVFLVDIDSKGIEETRALLADTDVLVETTIADCSNWDECKRYVQEALNVFGKIDGFFNNAGIEGDVGSITELTEKQWRQVLAVNLDGAFFGLRHVLPIMVDQGAGAIVNTGSLASMRGLPMTAPYVVSKHGILGLTRSAVSEVACKGVRVNTIMPGMIETRMLRSIAKSVGDGDEDLGLRLAAKGVPMSRIGQADEIARVVTFLLSDDASYMNGSEIAVDGGFLAVGFNGG
ncbi:MAG: oxidoreductase [Rhodobacteraceae bacterium]|nr:MAG: oxidoreductase [Paracoccaceae bacterium]